MKKFLLFILLLPICCFSQTGIYPQATASGTNTYTATVSGLTSLIANQRFTILFTNGNTGAATLDPDGAGAITAKPITIQGSSDLVSGDIDALSIKLLIYDGTRFQIIGDGGDSGGGSELPTLGTALQMLRVNSGGSALEYFTPTFNPMTTTGDIIQGGSSGVPTRLAGVATGNAIISGGLGTAIAWGKIGLSTHVSGDLPFSNLTQGSALSVLGVSGNATDDNASIVAATDNQVLRRSGTSIGFGAINLASSDAVTGILPIANFTTGTPTGSKFVRDDGVLAVPGVSSVIFNGLTGASGTNTIDNTQYAQEWQWSTLAGATGLKLSSTSTAAASNLHRLFEVLQSGANSNSAQTTHAGRFSNAKTGTTSVNVGAAFAASGGTTNLAIQTETGNVLIGNAASDAITSSTKLDIRGGGTSSSDIALRLATSGSVSRFLLSCAGTLNSTGTSQNTWLVTNTFTSDNTDRFNFSLAGTFTLAATTGITNRIFDNNMNFTTGSTNQIMVGAGYRGTVTFNHTGGTFVGLDHNPTISGTQTASASNYIIRASSGTIVVPVTITAGGTTGNQTINKISGTVNFAAAATTITVTNSLVTTSSLIFCTVRTNDATATIKNVVPGSGSFVITLNAAATAETSVGFFVLNGN